jgi:hypothetical protein
MSDLLDKLFWVTEIGSLLVHLLLLFVERQKWFHVNRISLLLDHDMPLNKHLHIPSSSGRYNSVYCRQAMEILNELLHRMSSFTLAEKHTYVTLLFRYKSIFAESVTPVISKYLCT